MLRVKCLRVMASPLSFSCLSHKKGKNKKKKKKGKVKVEIGIGLFSYFFSSLILIILRYKNILVMIIFRQRMPALVYTND